MYKGIVSMTFDDGWKCQYDHALPILDRYEIKATFYIITGCIGPTQPEYFGAAEIIALQAGGHEIGAHTVMHPNLFFTFPWKGREILQSKQDLSAIGIEARSFAYPYGRHHWLVRKMVKRSGFSNSRVVGNRFNGKRKDQWRIAGKSIKNSTTIGEVRSWIQTARENKYFLVLIFHQVEENPRIYGCTPSFLDEICQLLVSVDLPTATLSDGWELAKK
jgi:peptidoglycan/xylan/chitin deacetylase (PgdA/CDA1 family)